MRDGDQLVVSVDGGPPETITFLDKDFQRIDAATAEELARVVSGSEWLAGSVDPDGALVLSTLSRGGHSSLAIDPASTALVGLGLVATEGRAFGSGLRPARLVGQKTEPFLVAAGAEMTIARDGVRRKITFGRAAADGSLTAAQVCDVINVRFRRLARPSRDGRVILTSGKLGPDSSLQVIAGDQSSATADAARPLGFVGVAASSHPSRADPARIRCSGEPVVLRLVNLTSGPIEINFGTGAVTVPPRGALPVSPVQAADRAIQRLLQRGVARLAG